MESPWFLCDPNDAGNLISGSSAFSKSSLYIWKFLINELLKPSLKDFEHYFIACDILSHKDSLILNNFYSMNFS